MQQLEQKPHVQILFAYNQKKQELLSSAYHTWCWT